MNQPNTRLHLPNADLNREVLEGRQAFLAALTRLRPDALAALLDVSALQLNDLGRDALHLLSWTATSDEGPRLRPGWGVASWDQRSIDRLDTEYPSWRDVRSRIEQHIGGWGQRFNLSDPWLGAAGWGTLQSFRLSGSRAFQLPQRYQVDRLEYLPVDPDQAGYGVLGHLTTLGGRSTDSGSDPERLSIMVSLDEWHPLGGESRFDARARMVGALEQLVDEYLERIEAHARDHGAKPISEKRARRTGTPAAHYEWLVRWQVPPCESLRSIADQPDGQGIATRSLGEKTIQVALKDTAARIGLTRRSGRARTPK